MKDKNNNHLVEVYSLLVYRISLFSFNFFLFLLFTSHASNFARIYTNAYHPVMSHVLIVIFAISYFFILRNLMLLVSTLSISDHEKTASLFQKIGVTSVFLVFLLLLAQIMPEFLLSMNLQY